MAGERLWATGWPMTARRVVTRPSLRAVGHRRLQPLALREAEPGGDDDLVGLASHRVAEVAERPGRAGDGHRALVERARARRAHDLRLDDTAPAVDREVHRQLAVQLAAVGDREVARAARLDPV